jgi:NADPH-dependent 2,4-dienoyl-CoA reductase/sulfur reductase-like enzyme
VVAGLATGESITNPDTMFANAGIELIQARAERIDPKTKAIQLSDGRRIGYERLLLGQGASPIIPTIEGRDLQGVFALRTLSDAEEIRTYLETEMPRRLLFIGAGFISLELATLLAPQQSDDQMITVIELLNHPLPLMLDTEMGSKLQEYLLAEGLEMIMGKKVARILGENGKVSGVELASGEELAADMVFLNVGVRANTDLAEDIGLNTGRYGIKVNQFLETSDPDILAAGDCVEKPHFITKKSVPGQLRGPAVIQGRLAAKRLAGYSIAFPGVLNNSVVKLFDMYIASTGLTEEQAEREALETVSATVDSRSKHGMIPGVRPWSIKLVFERDSGRLLGGQILSEDRAPVKEIDTVNALILGEKTASDLTVLMCAGTPDCSPEPSLEPISIAAEQALQKLPG